MARSFVGTGTDYLLTNTGTAPPLSGTGSISLWAQPNWSAPSGANNYVWYYSGGIDFRLWNNNTTLNFQWFGGGGTALTVATTGLFVAGVWVHILTTWDGTGGTGASKANIYMNGTSVASSTTMNEPGTTNTILLIGSDSSNLSQFNGNLADFAMWNATLTQAEASALANGARPYTIRTPSLQAWYPITGSPTPVAIGEIDLSANKKNIGVAGTAQAFDPPFDAITPRWPIMLDAPVVGLGPPIVVQGWAAQEW